MAKRCIFCDTELTLFNRVALWSYGTEQPSCKSCYKELVKLPADERGRRILATGKAVAADLLQQQLAQQEANEASKRARRTSDISCSRCGTPMLKMGQQQFQLGEHSLFFGDLAHLAAGSLTLDLLCCETCRKVEFFLPNDEKPIDII